MIIHDYHYEEGQLLVVEVTGRANKEVKSQLVCAAEFYVSKLFKRRDALKIELFIKLKKLDNYVEGYCDFNYDYKYPEFEIEISSSASLDTMLQTLAHELIHAKQNYYKELILISHNLKWHGNPIINMQEQPWEDEAYEYEQVLFNNWIEYGSEKKKSTNIS